MESPGWKASTEEEVNIISQEILALALNVYTRGILLDLFLRIHIGTYAAVDMANRLRLGHVFA